MIYVTHDQTEALTMSDRIAVFNRGKLQQLDVPATLYDRPHTPFVAEFLGENNRFDGNIIGLDGDQCIVKIGNEFQTRTKVVGEAKAGQRVAVFVRPERVALTDDCPQANICEALVERVTFLGDQIRIHLKLAGDVTLFMKLQHAPGGAPQRLGQRSAWDGRAKTQLPFRCDRSAQ